MRENSVDEEHLQTIVDSPQILCLRLSETGDFQSIEMGDFNQQ